MTIQEALDVGIRRLARTNHTYHSGDPATHIFDADAPNTWITTGDALANDWEPNLSIDDWRKRAQAADQLLRRVNEIAGDMPGAAAEQIYKITEGR